MLNLSDVKNIIFDLGGVILNIDYSRTAKAFKELGVISFDEIYSQAKQNHIFDKLETGELSLNQFRDYIKKHTQNSTDIEIDAAWNAMLLDLPKRRVDLIKKLKNKYRIFLLSNTNHIHIKAFREIIAVSYSSNLFDTLFEKQYYSSEIGLRKPNEECFNYVLNENDLVATETLFIDDSVQHIEGAKKIGLQTYHLTSNEDITSLFPDKVL